MSIAANNRPSANDLYRWQKTAVNKLARSSSYLLAAQPGAGKTITGLTALPEGRTLLVAPRQIISSAWVREAERWEHTQKLVFDLAHDLEPISREWLIFDGTGDVVTVTPDMFPKVIEQIAEHGTIPFERIVIDESHLFNNPTGKRGRALLWISERVPVWLLSGTPTPNGVIDSYVPGFVTSNGGEFWRGGIHRWRNRHFDKRGFSWRPKRAYPRKYNPSSPRTGRQSRSMRSNPASPRRSISNTRSRGAITSASESSICSRTGFSESVQRTSVLSTRANFSR